MRYLKVAGLWLLGACLLAGAGGPARAGGAGDGKPGLSDLLKHKDREVRRKTLQVLIKLLTEKRDQLGPNAKDFVNPLIDTLADKDRVVRSSGAKALALIGPDAVVAVPALKDALKDRDFSVRLQAAIALYNIDRQVDVALPVFRAGLKQD